MKKVKSHEIYILGGGGHGKVVIDTIEAQFGNESILGILDDNPAKKNLDFHGHKIIGSIQDLKSGVSNLILAIGDNKTRQNRAFEIKKMVKSFISVVHPLAQIAPTGIIGIGTLVMPGVIINADAIIGSHCIINTGAIIEHDCIVGDFTHIAPGTVLTGEVKIGHTTLIGANSTIVPGISIGDNCLIGAGSVVTKNIPDFAIVRGNPAKIIKVLV